MMIIFILFSLLASSVIRADKNSDNKKTLIIYNSNGTTEIYNGKINIRDTGTEYVFFIDNYNIIIDKNTKFTIK